MRGGLLSVSPYISSAKTQAQQQLGQAASAVYGRVKVVSDKATEAMKEQATKILGELKEQVNAITDAALAELKIQASAAAKQAVAEALVAVKSQIKMG
jgi:CRISPR/Cas system CSM-associated protein Csm3 (group 7 of RAMP superfamily)